MPAAAGVAAQSAAAAAAGGDRIQAAAWAAAQISGSAVVGCDPAMCTVLRTQGVAAGNLVVIGAGGQSDPLGCNIVVATAAVRGALGARLTRVYAPLVLARFGSGSARIEMRVVAPDGTGAYLQALSADQAARTQAGAQLLANRRLSEAPAARRELAGGRVDTRLLTTIAALANGRRLRILQFGTAGPGADPRVPRPSAEIAAAGPGPARAELSAVAAFLRAQRSPYLATGISVTRLASGQLVLRVAFGEPGPLGLLSPASAWPARVASPAGRHGATIAAAGSARPGPAARRPKPRGRAPRHRVPLPSLARSARPSRRASAQRPGRAAAIVAGEAAAAGRRGDGAGEGQMTRPLLNRRLDRPGHDDLRRDVRAGRGDGLDQPGPGFPGHRRARPRSRRRRPTPSWPGAATSTRRGRASRSCARPSPRTRSGSTGWTSTRTPRCW